MSAIVIFPLACEAVIGNFSRQVFTVIYFFIFLAVALAFMCMVIHEQLEILGMMKGNGEAFFLKIE